MADKKAMQQMLDDLGIERLEDLPMEDGPYSHMPRRPGNQAPRAAPPNRPTGKVANVWQAAIANGDFQDSDYEAVKLLDDLGDETGRLYADRRGDFDMPIHPELHGRFAQRYHNSGREIPPSALLRFDKKFNVSRLGIVHLDGDAPILALNKHKGALATKADSTGAQGLPQQRPVRPAVAPNAHYQQGNLRPAVTKGPPAHPQQGVAQQTASKGPTPRPQQGALPSTATRVDRTPQSQSVNNSQQDISLVSPDLITVLEGSRPNVVFEAPILYVAQRRGKKESPGRVTLHQPPKKGIFQLFVMERLFAEHSLKDFHNYALDRGQSLLTVRFTDPADGNPATHGTKYGAEMDGDMYKAHTMRFKSEDAACEFLEILSQVWAGQEVPCLPVKKPAQAATQRSVSMGNANPTTTLQKPGNINAPAPLQRPGTSNPPITVQKPAQNATTPAAAHLGTRLAGPTEFDPFSVTFAPPRTTQTSSRVSTTAPNGGPQKSISSKAPSNVPSTKQPRLPGPPPTSGPPPAGLNSAYGLAPPPGFASSVQKSPAGVNPSGKIQLPVGFKLPPGLPIPPGTEMPPGMAPSPGFPPTMGLDPSSFSAAPSNIRPPPGLRAPSSLAPLSSQIPERPGPATTPAPGIAISANAPSARAVGHSAKLEPSQTDHMKSESSNGHRVQPDSKQPTAGSTSSSQEAEGIAKVLAKIVEMKNVASTSEEGAKEQVELLKMLLDSFIAQQLGNSGSGSAVEESQKKNDKPSSDRREHSGASADSWVLVPPGETAAPGKESATKTGQNSSGGNDEAHASNTGRTEYSAHEMISLRPNAVQPPHWLHELRFFPNRDHSAPQTRPKRPFSPMIPDTPTRPVPPLREQLERIKASAHEIDLGNETPVPTPVTAQVPAPVAAPVVAPVTAQVVPVAAPVAAQVPVPVAAQVTGYVMKQAKYIKAILQSSKEASKGVSNQVVIRTRDEDHSGDAGVKEPATVSQIPSRAESTERATSKPCSAGLQGSKWAIEDVSINHPNTFTGPASAWPESSYMNDLMQLVADPSAIEEPSSAVIEGLGVTQEQSAMDSLIDAIGSLSFQTNPTTFVEEACTVPQTNLTEAAEKARHVADEPDQLIPGVQEETQESQDTTQFPRLRGLGASRHAAPDAPAPKGGQFPFYSTGRRS